MSRKTTVRTAHKTFIQQLDQHLRVPSSKKTPAANTRRSKERLLSHYQERLAAATVARERAIARYDEEIERRQALVLGLEKELGKKTKPAAKRARKRAASRKKALS